VVSALGAQPARVPGRRDVVRGALVIAVGATFAFLVTVPGVVSRSDWNTLAALGAVVPGGSRALATAAAVALALVAVAVACRAWAPLLAGIALVYLGWMVAGVPALERAAARHDSLREFAHAVAARYPPPASLAFHPEVIRPIALYVGRPIPAVRRPTDFVAGTSVIVPAGRHRALADAGVLGPPLLTAEGRVGNIERARVVVAEVLAAPLRSARARPGTAPPGPPRSAPARPCRDRGR
jgi:hypothetical protein